MNTGTTLQISSPSLKKTEHIAGRIGARLRGGEVLALSSDLGGGKTAFVRGLARGMGSPDHVSSPTFTISKQYESPQRRLTLHHFDFYRLQEPGLMAYELSEVINDSQAVIAIEWGGIVENVLPDASLRIDITRTGENTRDIVISYPAEQAYLVTELQS